MNKERIKYFDFLRGLAIMMVVAIHTYSSDKGNAALALRQVFNCAVPLFLAISGFFLASKDLSNKNDYFAFLKHQIPKVYIPVLIWSLPLFIIGIINGRGFLVSCLLLISCGFSIYYFVALIMQCYVILPFLQKHKTLKWGGVICLVSMLYIIALKYITTRFNINLPLIAFAGPFLLWVMFFFEGIYISNTLRNYKIFWLIVAFACSIVFAYFETKYYESIGHTSVGIKPSSFVLSFFAIALLFSSQVQALFENSSILYGLVVIVGKYSFGIYLIHCYIINAVSKIFPSHITSNWFIEWLIVLILASFIVALGNKVLPKRISKYIGF